MDAGVKVLHIFSQHMTQNTGTRVLIILAEALHIAGKEPIWQNHVKQERRKKYSSVPRVEPCFRQMGKMKGTAPMMGHIVPENPVQC